MQNGRRIWRLMFFFFFSSRRRHTRLQGDWSSDVCSSDLPRLLVPAVGRAFQKMIEEAFLELDSVVGVERCPVRAGVHFQPLLLRRGPHEEIGRASCRERV